MTNEDAIKIISAIIFCDEAPGMLCANRNGCDGCQGYRSRDDEHEAHMVSIKALEKAKKYKWHDLRKNQDDLPVYVGLYEVYRPNTEHKYSICYMSGDGTWFDNYMYDETRRLNNKDVIAWREIEPFEEEEE